MKPYNAIQSMRAYLKLISRKENANTSELPAIEKELDALEYEAACNGFKYIKLNSQYQTKTMEMYEIQAFIASLVDQIEDLSNGATLPAPGAKLPEQEAYKAMETSLQLLTAQVLELRTEMLAVKSILNSARSIIDPLSLES